MGFVSGLGLNAHGVVMRDRMDELRATGRAQTRHIHSRKRAGDGFREQMRP